MANLLYQIINLLFGVIIFLLLIRALLSWFIRDYSHPFVRLVHDLTDPLLAPVRRVVPPINGIDFSPLVLLVLLQILGRVLEALLLRR